jgi:AP-3 complex subunit mu
LCVIDDEMPSLMAIDMCFRCLEIFKQYFGAVTADVLRKNFAVVYQLMDEVLDNGLPFNTEISLLKEVISPPSFADVIPLWARKKTAVLPTWGSDNSGAQVLWRKRGIKHTPNEIYLDVHEHVDAILDATGKAISMEVFGEVVADVSLSDMPDLTLVFKNSRVIGDVGLHNCVRYKRWEAERIISFVPPDGSFQLMTYRSKESIALPLYVQTQIHFNRDGGSVSVMLGLKAGVTDKPVEARVTIPFSLALASSKLDLKANYGKVTIDEATKTVTWDIGRLPKDNTSPHLEGKIHFSSGVSVAECCKPAVQVEWHCIGFLCSSLEVDSLSIANVAYSPFKGVKTLTKGGQFEVRS